MATRRVWGVNTKMDLAGGGEEVKSRRLLIVKRGANSIL